MVNAWYIRNPPWKQIDRERNNVDDLSPQWQTLEARCRETLGWRIPRVPYLSSALAQYVEGTPAFRALVLDFPDVSLHTVVWAVLSGPCVIGWINLRQSTPTPITARFGFP